jgi:hypothetical protein
MRRQRRSLRGSPPGVLPLEDVPVRLHAMEHSQLVMAVELPGPEQGHAWPQTRVARSWHRPPHRGYPGYDDTWPLFAEDLRRFSWSPRQRSPEADLATRCELTYANPLRPDEDRSHSSRLGRALQGWTGIDPAEHLLPGPQDARASSRFQITGPNGAPAGHLSVEIESVWVEAREPLAVMTLSATGRPMGPGLGGVKAFFDNGFEWVVRGFAALTNLGAGQTTH